MLHHPTDEDPRSSAHWATGLGAATAGDCGPPVLAQISNARADQVRIPMRATVAETLAAALRLAADAPPGTSLRAPVRHHSDAHKAQDGDGFGVYALPGQRVRVDFHWRGDFTATVIDRARATAFAESLEVRAEASRAQSDPGCDRTGA